MLDFLNSLKQGMYGINIFQSQMGSIYFLKNKSDSSGFEKCTYHHSRYL